MSLHLSALLLLGLALVQVTEADHLAVAGVAPALILIAVVSWSILRGGLEGLKWAIFGGLWLDLFSGFPMGSHLFALVVVAFLVGLGQRALFQSNLVFSLGTVVVASFLYAVTLLVLAGATGRHVAFEEAWQSTIMPSALYNAMLFPLVHALLVRLDRRFPLPVQPEW